MPKEKIFFKSFLPLKEEFGFKELVNFLDRDNFPTRSISGVRVDHILSSVFQIPGVQKNPEFSAIYRDQERQFNPDKKKSNLDIFFSMLSGVSGKVHVDVEQVYIIQLYGIVVYKLEESVYEVSPGDMLKIPVGKLHRAIGLTPRITLSYGLFNK